MIALKNLADKPKGNKLLGQFRHKLKDSTIMDLKEI
jgi:hypothetical protein